MATALPQTRRAPRDRWIEMNVDWKGYTAVLRARAGAACHG